MVVHYTEHPQQRGTITDQYPKSQRISSAAAKISILETRVHVKVGETPQLPDIGG